jgi:hypothetical protein
MEYELCEKYARRLPYTRSHIDPMVLPISIADSHHISMEKISFILKFETTTAKDEQEYLKPSVVEIFKGFLTTQADQHQPKYS